MGRHTVERQLDHGNQGATVTGKRDMLFAILVMWLNEGIDNRRVDIFITDGHQWLFLVYNCQRLCFKTFYVISQTLGDPSRVVVPPALQMIWINITEYFSCSIETIQKLINFHVENGALLPYNQFEEKLTVTDITRQLRSDHTSKPLQVYNDNFCNMATRYKDGDQFPNICWLLACSINYVFLNTVITGSKNGKVPIFQKKIDNGDVE